MFGTAAQLFEHWHRSGEIGLCASDKTEQLALFRRTGASADRTFDKGRALLQHRRAVRCHGVGMYRAHINHELAGEFGFQDAVRLAVNCLACGVIQQHHDSDFATSHKFRRGRE